MYSRSHWIPRTFIVIQCIYTCIYKKCQLRISLLQKLRKLNVNKYVLQLFYGSFIESILTYSFTRWYWSLKIKNKNVLERLVNACSKKVGVKKKGLNIMFEIQVRMQNCKIAFDSKHALAREYELFIWIKKKKKIAFQNLNLTATLFI